MGAALVAEIAEEVVDIAVVAGTPAEEAAGTAAGLVDTVVALDIAAQAADIAVAVVGMPEAQIAGMPVDMAVIAVAADMPAAVADIAAAVDIAATALVDIVVANSAVRHILAASKEPDNLPAEMDKDNYLH